MPYDYSSKCVLVGDSATGKSSLLLAFTDPGHFNAAHEATIGVEFAAKVVPLGPHTLKLQVWDTAGQEAFRAIVRTYYRGTAAALLVFDVTRRHTFDSLPSWLSEIRAHADCPELSLVLVGNKADLSGQQREVSSEEARLFAQAHGLEYVETSARTGDGVDAAFRTVAGAVLRKTLDGTLDPTATRTQGVRLGHTAAARAHAEGLRVRNAAGRTERSTEATGSGGNCCRVS